MPSTSVSSSESNATEGATLEIVPGREYARCWFDVVGANANLSCTSTKRGRDPLGASVHVATSAFRRDLDIEEGGTVLAGSVPLTSFPQHVLIQVVLSPEAKEMLGLEESWSIRLDVASPSDLPASRPITLGQPFDLWPVATVFAMTQGGGLSLKAHPYTQSAEPYRVGLAGGGELTFEPTLGHFDRRIFHVAAPKSGGPLLATQRLSATSPGESFEKETSLAGPGYWAVTDHGIRPATAEEIARDFGVSPPVGPTTQDGPTQGDPAVDPPVGPPAPVDPDPACGGDGQAHCADLSCDPGTRFDGATGRCIACGDAGQTFCFVDPKGMSGGLGGARCNAGTRLDLATERCVACGADGQTFCFVDPNGVTSTAGGARCNAGTRLDLATERCVACGADGQTFCFVDPNGVTSTAGGARCNEGLRVISSTQLCGR